MADGGDRSGVITGEVVSARFAFSGKIIKTNISPGVVVSRGQVLASLDRTQLQVELDRELKDFERIRADFEIFVTKQGADVSDLARYDKIHQQSLLDVSVKSVELAKLRLDQADLISPVDGIVVSDGGLRVGLYVTPSANPIEILDRSGLVFSLPVDWSDLHLYPVEGQFRIKLMGIDAEIPAVVAPFVPPSDPKKSPIIRFFLTTDQSLFPGMPGQLI